MEGLDLPLERGAPIAQHDPGGEYRQEPRPVGESGDTEQQQHASQRPPE